MEDIINFLLPVVIGLPFICLFGWFMSDDKRQEKFNNFFEKIVALGFYGAKIYLLIFAACMVFGIIVLIRALL